MSLRKSTDKYDRGHQAATDGVRCSRGRAQNCRGWGGGGWTGRDGTATTSQVLLDTQHCLSHRCAFSSDEGCDLVSCTVVLPYPITIHPKPPPAMSSRPRLHGSSPGIKIQWSEDQTTAPCGLSYNCQA